MTSWRDRTEAVLHRLSASLAGSEISEISLHVGCALKCIEPAPEEERARLALMLLNVCGTIVDTIHSRPPHASCSCHAAAWAFARRLSTDTEDLRTSFRIWSERFLAHAARQHRSTPAEEAAALMRADPARSWPLQELAARIAAPHGRLSRQFRNIFGIRPAEYLHLVRVSRAVGMFRSPAKVDAIARDLGYRSKKDFYAALRRWVGLTPGELRTLAEDERLWLEGQLRERLLTCRPPADAFVVREPANTPTYRQLPLHRR